MSSVFYVLSITFILSNKLLFGGVHGSQKISSVNINYQKNANQNYYEIPPYTQPEWPSSKSLQTMNAGEDVEKGNPLLLLVGM